MEPCDRYSSDVDDVGVSSWNDRRSGSEKLMGLSRAFEACLSAFPVDNEVLSLWGFLW